MASIDPTPSNLLQLFALISPLLLGFLLVMSSLFNQDIKGLVYLGGVLLATVINLFLMSMIDSKKDLANESAMCDIITLPLNLSSYNSPSISSLFIAFTTAYLVLPMKYNNQMNYVVLAFLLCLFALDAYTNINNKCTTPGGSILGGLVGVVLGAAWFAIFHYTGYSSLLYFDELMSNKVVCARPSKQTFKCSVYKNGKLISSNIA